MQIVRELVKRFLVLARVPLTYKAVDRVILEKEILPWLARQDDLSRVLFVGCDWYTSKYNRVFARKQYHTMDIDPTKRRYGSGRHVVDSMANLSAHFAPASLDLIICNGVYGWGLNDPNDIDKAFAGSLESLRPGGRLLLGWNDVEPHNAVPMSAIESLQIFESAIIEPLETSTARLDTPNNHVFSYFARP